MTHTYPNIIESVSAQDYPEIVTVWEASVRATHHFLQEADLLYIKPLLLKEFLEAVDLVCIRDEPGNTLDFLGTSADKIEMIFIRPDARGKGIGKLLLQYALENLQIKKVEVNEQNQPAADFYAYLGFKVINHSDLDGMGKPYPILSMALP